MRHTTATVLLEVGVHPKVVQDLLGHSTTAVTLDTYSNVAPALHSRPLGRSNASSWLVVSHGRLMRKQVGPEGPVPGGEYGGRDFPKVTAPPLDPDNRKR